MVHMMKAGVDQGMKEKSRHAKAERMGDQHPKPSQSGCLEPPCTVVSSLRWWIVCTP